MRKISQCFTPKKVLFYNSVIIQEYCFKFELSKSGKLHNIYYKTSLIKVFPDTFFEEVFAFYKIWIKV